MAGKIICFVTSLGCAALFYFIGVHAQKREKPMAFWSGSEVPESDITDTKQYNKENAIMWKLYSLWYVLAGVAVIWSEIAFGTLLMLACTVGFVQLILTYRHIYKKYKTQK